MQKVFTDGLARIESQFDARLKNIEDNPPASGGPSLRPVAKTIAGQTNGQPLDKKAARRNELSVRLPELRRMANSEPNLRLRQQYQSDLAATEKELDALG